MQSDGANEVLAALKLIRGGRFSEAVTFLDQSTKGMGSARRSDPVRESLLADALQRIGHNDRAESIASRHLDIKSGRFDSSGRCHFVLGNISRERGNLAKAIECFQLSATAATSDFELACWAQLRLIGAVAEHNGIQAAMSRIGEARSALARSGDARPFAALHLWLAEMESTRGHMSNAQRHLSRAEALLAQVEDVWLQGYLAINTSVVNYCCAEIDEARRWAELAIGFARASGHRGTRCAANASLGHIEFSEGHLSKAGEYFQVALDCCEDRSVSQIAVLDSIAQVKLQLGDLIGCRTILDRIEELAVRGEHAKSRHYELWALQTRVQLLLKEGRTEEARVAVQRLMPHADISPQPRVNTASYLLAAETLIATGEVTDAAQTLCTVLSPAIQIPPDLFAHAERITAKAISSTESCNLASVHLERAIRTFDAIGHRMGRLTASEELALLPVSDGDTPVAGARRALDRVRALMDTRSRSELLGHEAIALLEELKCADGIALILDNGTVPPTVIKQIGNAQSSSRSVCITLRNTHRGLVRLSFSPRLDPVSIVTALHFQRVIEQIIATETQEPMFADFDVVWAANDWSSSDGVVFANESMLSILSTVRKIATTSVSVLITGETGVGKEIIAKSIHDQSTRAAMPFLALNCAAVPKELLESQLFGHRKGAFSGANESFQGVVRAANGGTLLLDEIGELPIDAQAKLLRFLELGEVHPIGEAYPVKVNVRMLFATNDNLEKAVQENRFRVDLFHRMKVISIRIPPLRERRDEIPLLVNVFSKRFAREFSKEPPKFSDSAMELLLLYSWPGNVRELANEVRRVTALIESDGHVTPELLSSEISDLRLKSTRVPRDSAHITINLDQTIEQATALLERKMLEHALNGAGGQITDAAARLGLSRKGLYLKRRRLGLMGDSSAPSAARLSR
ncbi:MAG TPA: sigma 54-interacting transcriptional regulator [Vicinamibacterales bacterium]|nr:sigma 54-interacting transcriptional regulator [Vicinamibacterales bacterium]